MKLSDCLITVLVVLFDLHQSTGDSEAIFGHVSLSPCPPMQDEPHAQNVVVTIQLSSGPYYVCLNGFDRGAAAAVCRQRGFVDADPVPTDNGQMFYGKPDEDYGCSGEPTPTPTEVISHVYCPNVRNYSLNGELHVMRCSVGDLVPRNTCEHTTALKCRTDVKLTDDGYTYNGRVNFDSMDQHRGKVKINLQGTAKIVCLDGLKEEAREKIGEAIGSSVCRQIGFTNGTGISLASQNSDDPSYQFSSLYCNSETKSYQCFSHCINQTEAISKSKCDNVLSVTCSYDPSIAELMTSGSPGVCSLQDTSPYYISTIVLGAVLGAENIPICLICAVYLAACLRRRCHWCYRPIPGYNDQNRPNAGEHQVLFRNNNDGYQRED